MTNADLTAITQAIVKIIDAEKNTESFQLAKIIVSEVVVPFIETEKSVYERLLFTPKRNKDSAH